MEYYRQPFFATSKPAQIERVRNTLAVMFDDLVDFSRKITREHYRILATLSVLAMSASTILPRGSSSNCDPAELLSASSVKQFVDEHAKHPPIHRKMATFRCDSNDDGAVRFFSQMKIVSPCWKASAGNKADDGFSLSHSDGLFWYKNVGNHVAGEFSMAIMQANSQLEDGSQIESSPLSSSDAHDTINGTFVGIYDGHGGPETTRFITENLFGNLKSGGHSCFIDGDEARIRKKRRKMWEKAVDIEELCGNGEAWWGIRGEMRDDFNQSNKAISYLDHFHISRFVESLLDVYWELPPVAGPSLTHQTRYDPARTSNPIVEDGQNSLFQRLGLTRLDSSVFNGYTQMVYVKISSPSS